MSELTEKDLELVSGGNGGSFSETSGYTFAGAGLGYARAGYQSNYSASTPFYSVASDHQGPSIAYGYGAVAANASYTKTAAWYN